MKQRTRLIVNSLANTTARVIAVGIRFVLIPFTIGIVGRGHYGLWVIVGQIFAYTRILDMGLRSAIERAVAKHLARGEPEIANRYVNTAAAYYTVVALLIAVFTGVVAHYFTDWYEVEQELHWAVRGMVLCSGLAIAFSIPQAAYTAVVSGLQRWDLLSASEVATDIVRAALILGLLAHVSPGWALVLLAAATGGTRLASTTLKTLAALRLCKDVRLEPWRADLSLLGGMMTFGLNSIVYILGLNVGSQLAQIMIGAFISSADAADFAVALALVTAYHLFVLAFGISARVVAARYDSKGNEAALRHLLLRSARYSGTVSLAGVFVLVVFVDAVLRLWIGGSEEYGGPQGALLLERIGTTCRVLTLAYGLFWMQMPAHNVVVGMGRHRFPALIAVASGAVSMVVVAIAASTSAATIVHVAWALVLPIIPGFAVLLPWYCCRQVTQPIGRYLWEGYGIPALGCLPAGVAGFLLNYYLPAYSWQALIGELACCGLVLALCGWFGVLARDDRSSMIKSAVALYRRLS